MRYLLIKLFLAFSIFANAQQKESMQRGDNLPAVATNKNVLLDPTFWQNKPTVNDVKVAVAKGNTPAELNAMAMDPVVLAINSGAANEAILYLLEQKGNDVNKITHDSRTYIFWAANKGNVEVMQHLLTKGAKVNLQDSHGSTPLIYAAQVGQQNIKVYDLFIQHGVNLKTEVSGEGANALLLAAANDPELKLTSYFQSKGLDIQSKDAAGNTAFDYAARSGNIDVMKKLLSKGVSFSNNAMLLAAQGSRRGGNTLEVFQYLESLGIKPTVTSKNGENVLHAIVRRPGQTAIINYFLSKGVDVNQVNDEGNTVFMNAAAFSKDTATIALLKPLIKNIDRANKNGVNALALAVRNNSPEVVEYLLKNGANKNFVDAKGNNLVYYLLESYNPRQANEFAIKLNMLKQVGVNLATPQKDGNTIYHLAVAKNDLQLLKLIQPYGADVNLKNAEGLTALHKAAMMSKDETIMQYLISIGAKKDLKTNFDETAFDLANENELIVKQKISVDFLK